jgi:hypothetical protein
MCSTAAFDFRKCTLDAKGCAVRPVRRHRFHHISDRHDARLRDDFVTLQTVRVAAAVEAFVVLLTTNSSISALPASRRINRSA